MTALTGDELLAWVDTTAAKWRELLREHPEALGLACDVMDTGTVAKLLQHVVAVELRYAERLSGVPETSYEAVPSGTADAIFSVHDQAMAMLRVLLGRPEFGWEAWIEFQTRSRGLLRATRRTVLVHTLMHSIRHYAQLATLVRQQGVTPGWAMDYLFMGAEQPPTQRSSTA